MYRSFTEQARKVVFYAQEEAIKFSEGYVSTEHLLLGLIRDPVSTAMSMLEDWGLNPNLIRKETTKCMVKGDAKPNDDMTLTPRAKRVIDWAYEEMRSLNHQNLGTGHLLIGLTREGDGLAGRVLKSLGLSDKELERLRVLLVKNIECDEWVKSALSQQALRQFMVKAMKEGYAAGNADLIEKQADGSETITVIDGPWKAIDNWFGGDSFEGRLVIYYQNVELLTMGYSGHLLDPGASKGKEIYGFLTRALTHIPEVAPYRGPGSFQDGSFQYLNTWVGDLTGFSGEEEVIIASTEVYVGNYHGRLLRDLK